MILSVLAATALLAAPSVSEVTLRQDASRTVTVSYNGSAIGSTTIETLTAVERSELERTFHETKTFAQTYWWVFLLLILLVLVILTAVLFHVRAEKKRHRAAMRARRPGAQNRRPRP